LKKQISKYDEYTQRNQAIKKRTKKLRTSEWFWSKGITLLNTLLALIAAVASVIALLK